MTANDIHNDTLTILLTQKHPAQQESPQAWYWPTRRIAKSRFNTVYDAIDNRTGRELIIKETRSAHLADRSFGDLRLRLASEGGMLCFLARRSILAPRYYNYYIVGGRAYLAMSKIPGKTLDLLRAEGDLSPRQMVSIIARVCLTAHRLHRNGYVHHDIKPSNIVVLPNGVPVLIDWGSAEAIRPPTDLRLRGMSTPGFVGPDQARGSARPGNDIYALGMTLDALIQWPGPRLTEIIRRAIASTEEQYLSAAAMARDLLQLSLFESLVNQVGLKAI